MPVFFYEGIPSLPLCSPFHQPISTCKTFQGTTDITNSLFRVFESRLIMQNVCQCYLLRVFANIKMFRVFTKSLSVQGVCQLISICLGCLPVLPFKSANKSLSVQGVCQFYLLRVLTNLYLFRVFALVNLYLFRLFAS